MSRRAIALVLLATACGGTAGDRAGGGPDLSGTDWVLVSIDGRAPEGAHRVTLEIAEGRLGGFGGCNAYGGPYAAMPDGTFEVGSIEQTAMACADPASNDRESEYLRRLGSATRYRTAGDDLTVEGGAGTLVFRRAAPSSGDPADLPGTAWSLEALDGRRPAQPFTLAFQDSAVAVGRAACRVYLATWAPGDGRISFASQSMAGEPCAEETEGAFTDQLTWARRFRLDGERLELHGLRGEMLQFVRVDAAPDLAGTHWRLLAFDRAPGSIVLDEPVGEVTLELREGGRVTGRAACNTYDGAWEQRGRSLTIGPLVATQMYCTDELMEQEARWLGALAGAATFIAAGDVLRIATRDGTGLLLAAE